jgi:hypothetical protein
MSLNVHQQQRCAGLNFMMIHSNAINLDYFGGQNTDKL